MFYCLAWCRRRHRQGCPECSPCPEELPRGQFESEKYRRRCTELSQYYIDVLAEASIGSWQSIEHLLSFDSVVNYEVQPQKGSLDDRPGNKFPDWTDFEQPVPAYFLRTFRNVGRLEVLNAQFVDPLLWVFGEAEHLYSPEDIHPELLYYLHHVGKFQSVEFLSRNTDTALEVSCSSLQAWMAICKLPTLSFWLHLVLISFFILWIIFI